MVATPPTQPPTPVKPAPVTRKGSLREKIRNHLPAALSLDRRKKNTNNTNTSSSDTARTATATATSTTIAIETLRNHQYQGTGSTAGANATIGAPQDKLNPDKASSDAHRDSDPTQHSSPAGQSINAINSSSSSNNRESLDRRPDSITEESVNVTDDTVDRNTSSDAVNGSRISTGSANHHHHSHYHQTTTTTGGSEKSSRSSDATKRTSSGDGGGPPPPITPLKCKLINASHRGSLDCLSTSPLLSHGQQQQQQQGRQDTATNQHKSWTRSPHDPHPHHPPFHHHHTPPPRGGSGNTSTTTTPRRPSPVPRSMSTSAASFNSDSPKTPSHEALSQTFSTPPLSQGGVVSSSSPLSSMTSHNNSSSSFGGGSRPSSVDRLKKAGNYRPVVLKSRGEPMKTAFVMGLDQIEGRKSSSISKSDTSVNMSGTIINATLSGCESSCLSPSIRPQVPPRTKFLSPSERSLESHQPNSGSPLPHVTPNSNSNNNNSSSSTNIMNNSSSNVSNNSAESVAALLLQTSARGRQLSNLDISQTQHDESDQPRTPLKVSNNNSCLM